MPCKSNPKEGEKEGSRSVLGLLHSEGVTEPKLAHKEVLHKEVSQDWAYLRVALHFASVRVAHGRQDLSKHGGGFQLTAGFLQGASLCLMQHLGSWRKPFV